MKDTMISIAEAVNLIKEKRPDFKIASLFKHQKQWHAVYDDGPDSCALIVVKINGENVVGVDPYSEESERTKLLESMNNRAYRTDGTRIPPFRHVEKGKFIVDRILSPE